MAELTYAQVSALLKYDPETGQLFWLERSAELFKGGSIGDDAAARRWNNRYAGKEAFTSKTSWGYRQGSIFDQKASAHRVAWLLFYGEWPILSIDHINGVKSDNRICNLRQVTKSGNARNQIRNPRNTSGFCGVTWQERDKRWVAQIKVDGVYRRLGSYHTKDEAAAARLAANEKFGFSERHGL